MRSRSALAEWNAPMFGPMNSQAKALTRRDLMDLIRAAFILAITVAAAMIVPAQVFG
jgi:hypothetical protein